MTTKPPSPMLSFPIPVPPALGTPTLVAPGIHLVRLALPFRLDHVNVYLLDDGDGVVAFDTGIGNADTRAVWEALLAGPLHDRPLTRIIATHFHPDHAGMAGWLAARTRAPLLMSQTEYLTSVNVTLDPGGIETEPYRDFYLGHGLDGATAENLLNHGQLYLEMTSGFPRTFTRVVAGEVLQIGERRFDVLSGGGHAPEQIMLYCAADRIFLCADQVLARISPNIGVQAMDPEGDPLGIFLRSLSALQVAIPADALVLPGHDLPFIGLHARLNELRVHHEERCAAILAACRSQDLTGAELVPVVFHRPIEGVYEMGFAFCEALAHANRMRRDGRLRLVDRRFRAA